MNEQSKSDDKLVETGKPDDPAKKENPDTREEQQQPFRNPEDQAAAEADNDPALETTRKAGQGAG